jgi:hypothetical protein
MSGNAAVHTARRTAHSIIVTIGPIRRCWMRHLPRSRISSGSPCREKITFNIIRIQTMISRTLAPNGGGGAKSFSIRSGASL